jgi:hypothetical protein
MVGLLVAIGIQGPLTAGDYFCINSTSESTDFNLTTPDTTTNTSVWDENKYFFIAAILTVFFVAGFVMLILFVKEDPG